MPESNAKVVVVTGANRGIGLEVCRMLAAKGHRVVLTSRDPAAGEAAAKKLGERVVAAPLDVTSPASIAELATRLRRDHGSLHAVVNNAGASFDGFDASVVARTMAVNLWGAIDVTDALAPLVSDGGSIVNVSSGMGNLGVYPASIRARFAAPALTRAELRTLVEEFAAAVAAGTHARAGWPTSAYRVSKAALNAFTRIAARELAPRKIAVTAVDPGWVQTRMGGRAAPRSVERGADTIAWLCDEPAARSGTLYFDREPTEF
jgi:NAD(P)-dependent dehydrogenase (short-subunit alcohol dehydrogenase family)